MKRLFRRIRAYVPHRRRRRWRYVSGRRRRRSLALMALIILAVSGWYYFTNDARIKRKAVAYLQQLTGVEVRIQGASFTVFHGIRLTGVRIFYEADGRVEDILQARELRLEHKPLSLLSGGGLAVTEIICVEPELTITENVDRGTWNYQRLFGGFHPGGPSDAGDLPIIRIREGRVIRKEILHGAMIPLCVEKLSAHAVPVAGARQYHIEVRGDQADEPVRAAATFTLSPVAFTWEGDVPAALLKRTLPHGYRQWWKAWQVGGVFSFAGRRDMAGDRLVLTLTEATMTLPVAAGDVRLTDLNGQIVLTRQGVEDVNVTGRLPQLAGASVAVTGYFEGFERTSPMAVQIDIADLQFPLVVDDDPLGQWLGLFQREFRPVGRMAMTVDVVRDAPAADGVVQKVRYQGTARPEGMDMTVGFFPLPLTDLQGEVRFDSQRITLTELTGRSGEAAVTVNGTVDVGPATGFDVHVKARQLPLGDPLRDVLAASKLKVVRGSVRSYYDRFDPTGACGVDVHVFTGPGGKAHVEVDLILDGSASAVFDGFPYRLEGLSGVVTARGDGIVMEALRGGRGKARVRLDGAVNGWEQPRGFTIGIQAWDVALDDQLGAAIGALMPAARRQYDAFALAGVADISGEVARTGDGPIRYGLTATLKSASMEYAEFPYRLDEVFGELQFTPGEVRVKRLVGYHGRGRVEATGSVYLRHDTSAAATGERAEPGLVIEAKQIAWDADLQRAVRETRLIDMPDVWKILQPTGEADFRFELGDGGGRSDFFPLQITARDMSVTYREFPYTLRNLRGRILLRPDRVELHDVVAGPADAPITLAGAIDIDTDSGRVRLADLTLGAVGLPIDSDLLDAVPEGLDAVVGLLRPGGRCDIEVSRLRYRALPPAVDEPTAATQPAAELPDGPWRWDVAGKIRLHDATFGANVPATQVRGTIEGSVQADDGRGGLRVDASLAADSFLLWGRKAERLSGVITKDPHDTQLRVSQLITHFCGGRLGGNITVELGDPSRYTVALFMEEAQLADLLNVDPAVAATEVAGTGELSGRLDLTETVGQAALREGRGRFRISGAQIGKVPILLGLVNVVFLQLPNESAFSTGEMEYYIKGDRLVFDRIYLEGTNRSVVGLVSMPTSTIGRGEVDIQTGQVNVLFRSGPPGILRGMVFGQLWELTAEGLLNTHVTGSWRAPKVRQVLFRQLEELLHEIGGVD